MGFSLLICQIGIQGVPFIQNRCIWKWICISKELNKYKVPNHSSCQRYLPLAHPPGVQLVFHGQGRAESGISLPHVPTHLQGQGLRQAQCLAQGKREHCKAGRKRERGMRPGRERRQPHMSQKFHAWILPGIVGQERNIHLAPLIPALKGQVL